MALKTAFWTFIGILIGMIAGLCVYLMASPIVKEFSGHDLGWLYGVAMTGLGASIAMLIKWAKSLGEERFEQIYKKLDEKADESDLELIEQKVEEYHTNLDKYIKETSDGIAEIRKFIFEHINKSK